MNTNAKADAVSGRNMEWQKNQNMPIFLPHSSFCHPSTGRRSQPQSVAVIFGMVVQRRIGIQDVGASAISAYFRLIQHISALPGSETGKKWGQKYQNSRFFCPHLFAFLPSFGRPFPSKVLCLVSTCLELFRPISTKKKKNPNLIRNRPWACTSNRLQRLDWPPKNQGESRWLKLNQGESRPFETFLFYAKSRECGQHVLLDKVEKNRISPKTWYWTFFGSGMLELVANQNDPAENERIRRPRFLQFLENFSGGDIYPRGRGRTVES